MNAPLTPRAQEILKVLVAENWMPRVAIEQTIGETRVNTIRELSRLTDQGYVVVKGSGRATTYTATERARRLTLWDVERYLAQEPDQRRARYDHINQSLFTAVHGIFSPSDLELTHTIQDSFRSRRTSDLDAAQRELERFVIELSWKSSKIEGNTYTLLDTEQLLREDVEAPGHSQAEANMILGHKRAFDYIWTHQKSFRRLTRAQLEDVHQLLTNGLGVPRGLRTGAVGITGTAYLPPASRVEISSYLDALLETINTLKEPVEKALACLVLLPYLQPFVDGNKRTSRLMANAVLLAHGYPPLSYRSIDEQAYKGALILFYEQGALANFGDLFLEQLRFAADNYFL